MINTKNASLFLKSLPLLLLLTACGGGAGGDDFASSNQKTEAPGSTASAASNPNTGKPGNATQSSTKSSSSAAAKDTTFPTQPIQLVQVSVLSSKVEINWTAATDNVAVTGYKVYRDNILLANLTPEMLSYSDTTTSPKQIYLYGVSAGDAAGNWSSQKLLSITTPAALVSGSASLKWSAPTERENGKALASAELGGFELRYRNTTENSYHYQSLDKTQTQITLSDLTGDYIFEVAAFDTEGLYSNFVSLTPH